MFIAYKQFRHNGYGTFAIKEMIKYAKINDYKNIVLNVRDSNIKAYEAYKKLGFVETNQCIKDNGIFVISMNYVI